MQYTRRDWRNRNLIKTPKGLKWLTIPVEVKGKYYQKINSTKVADKTWIKNHLAQIRHNYSKAKAYKEVYPWLEDLYNSCKYEFLTDINLHFINSICRYLEIKTEITFSSKFSLHEDRTQRLVNICKNLDSSDYYSGPSARNYLEEHKFTQEDIRVHYFDYSNYEEYFQLYPPFQHSVSILDLLLNEGKNSSKLIKFNQ